MVKVDCATREVSVGPGHHIPGKPWYKLGSEVWGKLAEKSEEAIVPEIVRTTEPYVGKGLCFNHA